MVGRTQEELEQPAKVYQLNAVDAKVEQALSLLKTIADQTSGLVNQSQLDAVIKDAKADVTAQLDNEIKKVHLKYGPTYKGIWWVVGSMGAGLIAMFWAMINNFWRGP